MLQTTRDPVVSQSRLLPPVRMRLSEIISALSTALDITEGQPAGHAARSCLIGMRVAQELCLDHEQRWALFYALLLKDLGCSSNAAKMCWLFGADDREIKQDLKAINWSRPTECLKFSLTHVAPGGSTVQKALRLAAMAREGEAGARKLVETRCERGADIVRMLELPELTAAAVRNLDEHWDGRGHPDGCRGEEIPLLARIACLAQTVEVFFTNSGLPAALEVVRERRGTWFDPEVADACLALAGDMAFWQDVAQGDPRAQLVRWEPHDVNLMADDAKLDQIATAFAQVVDAKSPWTCRHSEGVAEIARGIARELGLSPDMQHDLWRAGLLHDLGKLGVSNLILDKPGRPTDDEFAQIKKHPDYTARILGQIPGFAALTQVAAAHHEKLDGRGYHRGMAADDLPLEARILAVADVCEALTAKRPYRDELPLEKVREIMGRDAGKSLCPHSISALHAWQDKTSITPRVEAQLDEIDRMLKSL